MRWRGGRERCRKAAACVFESGSGEIIKGGVFGVLLERRGEAAAFISGVKGRKAAAFILGGRGERRRKEQGRRIGRGGREVE
jgi:hypothetical protein